MPKGHRRRGPEANRAGTSASPAPGRTAAAAARDVADPGIVMAQIGAPHGVRGWVKLTVFAEDPARLRRYNPFHDQNGRVFTISALKPVGKAITAEIDGVGDRDAATLLRGTLLHVDRARLPAPDDDEFYHVDLIGLEARLADGTVLGHVRGIADHGAGDILELTGGQLLPFTRAIVPEVNIAEGFVTVEPPAGLLEDAEPEDGEDGAPSADRS